MSPPYSDWACGVRQDGGSWQAGLRALYALESVVQQGSSASCGEVAVYFQALLHCLCCPHIVFVGFVMPSVIHEHRFPTRTPVLQMLIDKIYNPVIQNILLE